MRTQSKRFLITILALLLVLTALPVSVLAEEAPEQETSDLQVIDLIPYFQGKAASNAFWSVENGVLTCTQPELNQDSTLESDYYIPAGMAAEITYDMTITAGAFAGLGMTIFESTGDCCRGVLLFGVDLNESWDWAGKGVGTAKFWVNSWHENGIYPVWGLSAGNQFVSLDDFPFGENRPVHNSKITAKLVINADGTIKAYYNGVLCHEAAGFNGAYVGFNAWFSNVTIENLTLKADTSNYKGSKLDLAGNLAAKAEGNAYWSAQDGALVCTQDNTLDIPLISDYYIPAGMDAELSANVTITSGAAAALCLPVFAKSTDLSIGSFLFDFNCGSNSTNFWVNRWRGTAPTWVLNDNKGFADTPLDSYPAVGTTVKLKIRFYADGKVEGYINDVLCHEGSGFTGAYVGIDTWRANATFENLSLRIGTPVNAVATQTAKTENGYHIRFVATVDSLDYVSCGFEVLASNGTKCYRFTLEDCVVYTSILATTSAGISEPVSAESLGGKYLIALTIRDVPSDFGDVTFTVTPFAVEEGGVRICGTTKTASYLSDGTPANS